MELERLTKTSIKRETLKANKTWKMSRIYIYKHLATEKANKTQNDKGSTIKQTPMSHILLIHPECITVFCVRNDKSIPATLCKCECNINISLTLKGS